MSPDQLSVLNVELAQFLAHRRKYNLTNTKREEIEEIACTEIQFDREKILKDFFTEKFKKNPKANIKIEKNPAEENNFFLSFTDNRGTERIFACSLDASTSGGVLTQDIPTTKIALIFCEDGKWPSEINNQTIYFKYTSAKKDTISYLYVDAMGKKLIEDEAPFNEIFTKENQNDAEHIAAILLHHSHTNKMDTRIQSPQKALRLSAITSSDPKILNAVFAGDAAEATKEIVATIGKDDPSSLDDPPSLSGLELLRQIFQQSTLADKIIVKDIKVTGMFNLRGNQLSFNLLKKIQWENIDLTNATVDDYIPLLAFRLQDGAKISLTQAQTDSLKNSRPQNITQQQITDFINKNVIVIVPETLTTPGKIKEQLEKFSSAKTGFFSKTTNIIFSGSLEQHQLDEKIKRFADQAALNKYTQNKTAENLKAIYESAQKAYEALSKITYNAGRGSVTGMRTWEETFAQCLDRGGSINAETFLQFIATTTRAINDPPKFLGCIRVFGDITFDSTYKLAGIDFSKITFSGKVTFQDCDFSDSQTSPSFQYAMFNGNVYIVNTKCGEKTFLGATAKNVVSDEKSTNISVIQAAEPQLPKKPPPAHRSSDSSDNSGNSDGSSDNKTTTLKKPNELSRADLEEYRQNMARLKKEGELQSGESITTQQQTASLQTPSLSSRAEELGRALPSTTNTATQTQSQSVQPDVSIVPKNSVLLPPQHPVEDLIKTIRKAETIAGFPTTIDPYLFRLYENQDRAEYIKNIKAKIISLEEAKKRMLAFLEEVKAAYNRLRMVEISSKQERSETSKTLLDVIKEDNNVPAATVSSLINGTCKFLRGMKITEELVLENVNLTGFEISNLQGKKIIIRNCTLGNVNFKNLQCEELVLENLKDDKITADFSNAQVKKLVCDKLYKADSIKSRLVPIETDQYNLRIGAYTVAVKNKKEETFFNGSVTPIDFNGLVSDFYRLASQAKQFSPLDPADKATEALLVAQYMRDRLAKKIESNTERPFDVKPSNLIDQMLRQASQNPNSIIGYLLQKEIASTASSTSQQTVARSEALDDDAVSVAARTHVSSSSSVSSVEQNLEIALAYLSSKKTQNYYVLTSSEFQRYKPLFDLLDKHEITKQFFASGGSERKKEIMLSATKTLSALEKQLGQLGKITVNPADKDGNFSDKTLANTRSISSEQLKTIIRDKANSKYKHFALRGLTVTDNCNFNGMNLSGWDFSKMTFTGTVDFSYANISEAIFDNTAFQELVTTNENTKRGPVPKTKRPDAKFSKVAYEIGGIFAKKFIIAYPKTKSDTFSLRIDDEGSEQVGAQNAGAEINIQLLLKEFENLDLYKKAEKLFPSDANSNASDAVLVKRLSFLLREAQGGDQKIKNVFLTFSESASEQASEQARVTVKLANETERKAVEETQKQAAEKEKKAAEEARVKKETEERAAKQAARIKAAEEAKAKEEAEQQAIKMAEKKLQEFKEEYISSGVVPSDEQFDALNQIPEVAKNVKIFRDKIKFLFDQNAAASSRSVRFSSNPIQVNENNSVKKLEALLLAYEECAQNPLGGAQSNLATCKNALGFEVLTSDQKIELVKKIDKNSTIKEQLNAVINSITTVDDFINSPSSVDWLKKNRIQNPLALTLSDANIRIHEIQTQAQKNDFLSTCIQTLDAILGKLQMYEGFKSSTKEFALQPLLDKSKLQSPDLTNVKDPLEKKYLYYLYLYNTIENEKTELIKHLSDPKVSSQDFQKEIQAVFTRVEKILLVSDGLFSNKDKSFCAAAQNALNTLLAASQQLSLVVAPNSPASALTTPAQTPATIVGAGRGPTFFTKLPTPPTTPPNSPQTTTVERETTLSPKTTTTNRPPSQSEEDRRTGYNKPRKPHANDDTTAKPLSRKP